MCTCGRGYIYTSKRHQKIMSLMAFNDGSGHQYTKAGDLLLLEHVTLNRMDIVNELWNRNFGIGSMTLQKYIMTYRKYMPMKCAILYAYECISHQSPEEAQQYYDEVKNNYHTYTQPGEARTALAIMERIKES